ncbi:MAG TPA: tyrosine-type recombinase/integrase [Lachnospiraceae bacterium]|nr:tyrosine-type recombinase/integrase [Lachnospiraceae bacterium]
MKTYDNYVLQMSELLKERHICQYSCRAHEKCYLELREYMISGNLNYSLQNARNWLNITVKPAGSFADYHAKWHYIDQLDEVIRTGTVLQDHLLLTKPNYEKLTEKWRNELDDYLRSRESDYTTRSFALAKIRCSGYLLFLQELGMSSVEEISTESICNFYELEMPVTSEERYIILSHARQFLSYYVTARGIDPVLPMLLEEDIYNYAVSRTSFTPDTISKITIQSDGLGVFGPEKVLKTTYPFLKELENHGYKDTAKYNASHIIRCLYVFLRGHNLDYSPYVARQWYELIGYKAGSSYRTWIRILNMFERFILNQDLAFDRKYMFDKPRTAEYPNWCIKAVEGYLSWLKRSFHSDSTVRSYKYSVYDLCDYLLSHGLKGFDSLTKSMIIDYLRKDHHTTMKGVSTRRTVLRQFVTYLEDNELVNDKRLHYVFPDKVASQVRIVTVLSEEQVSGIDVFRKECASAIDYRDAAMVMTGLRLGFRSSDVINLKLSNVDWKNRTVSIVQCKTKVPITLPLGTDVGNSLFRYLKYGRPICESEYIFVRHKAPYSKLTGKICSNALNRILEACGFDTTVSFHILRKTFATAILRNNAGINRVVDALGHQDMTTVNKYLTFDEEHMRKCPLSLNDLSIGMGGACK